MARPCEFTQEVADAICEAIAEGRALRNICCRDGMPASSTVGRWLAANVEFRRQYTVAREIQAEILIDEILQIADDKTGDEAAEPAEGAARETGVAVHRARLRVDTRKWLIGRLAPKRYGEKLDVDLNTSVKLGKLNWRKRP